MAQCTTLLSTFMRPRRQQGKSVCTPVLQAASMPVAVHAMTMSCDFAQQVKPEQPEAVSPDIYCIMSQIPKVGGEKGSCRWQTQLALGTSRFQQPRAGEHNRNWPFVSGTGEHPFCCTLAGLICTPVKAAVS